MNSVKLNGVVIQSVRKCAKLIVDSEKQKGNSRNFETVRKEVKRIALNFNRSRVMYGEYLVEPV
jgi:hypothetical protein